MVVKAVPNPDPIPTLNYVREIAAESSRIIALETPRDEKLKLGGSLVSKLKLVARKESFLEGPFKN